jgi:hypothetical protein
MMADLMDITPQRPLVIDSYEKLCVVVKEVLADSGVINKPAESITATQKEFVTRDVKKMMAAKGYLCTSHTAFTQLMTDHGVRSILRGRDLWWNAEDLNKIPARCL